MSGYTDKIAAEFAVVAYLLWFVSCCCVTAHAVVLFLAMIPHVVNWACTQSDLPCNRRKDYQLSYTHNPRPYLHPCWPSVRACRPTQYVYKMFEDSAACETLGGGVSYPYFVKTWNDRCSHVHLKRAMRFTKCDVCVLSTEALDRARQHGGDGWRSADMIFIERQLLDHYRVRVLFSSRSTFVWPCL